VGGGAGRFPALVNHVSLPKVAGVEEALMNHDLPGQPPENAWVATQVGQEYYCRSF